jgi:hypothetical protein
MAELLSQGSSSFGDLPAEKGHTRDSLSSRMEFRKCFALSSHELVNVKYSRITDTGSRLLRQLLTHWNPNADREQTKIRASVIHSANSCNILDVTEHQKLYEKLRNTGKQLGGIYAIHYKYNPNIFYIGRAFEFSSRFTSHINNSSKLLIYSIILLNLLEDETILLFI